MSHLKDSNLAQIILLLRPEEYKKLKVWLTSPWANSNKKLLPLCEMLLKYAPDFDNPALLKKQVFKKLFPGKSYNNRLINNTITECSRQIESFLVHESINNETQHNDLLRKEMLKRENAKIFESLTQKLIQELEQQKIKSADEHRQLALLYLDLYYQPSEHLRYYSDKDLLGLINRHLDAYYALIKCKLWHEAQDQSSITRKNNNLITNQLMLDFFKKNSPEPAIKLYSLRLQRKRQITWDDFLHFQKLYYKQQHLLPLDLQRNFFYYCLNDLVRLDASGYKQAVDEMFKLYKRGLEHQLLLEHQQMSSVTFNNIIMAASHLDEAAFADQFIQNYTQYLPPEIQQDAQTWATGQLAYLNKQFDHCQDIFNRIKIKNELFQIQSRITLLKTYFETAIEDKTNHPFFVDYCASSEQFIIRKKLLAKPKSQSYIRFIQLMKRMANLVIDEKTASPKWEKLLRDINTETNLTGKHWLLKKVSQFSR